MAEEEPKKKINFMKIALFGLGPIVLIGIGLGVGAFLFMPTQTPVEQVEELIEKSFNRRANFRVVKAKMKRMLSHKKYIKILHQPIHLSLVITPFQIILLPI